LKFRHVCDIVENGITLFAPSGEQEISSVGRSFAKITYGFESALLLKITEGGCLEIERVRLTTACRALAVGKTSATEVIKKTEAKANDLWGRFML
jgi:hypothetical protein